LADLSLLPPSAVVSGADLLIGGCPVTGLASEFGTPAFVVDERALRATARAYVTSMTSAHERSLVLFAVKAFPSVSVIRVLVSEGLGCDVVGAGELRLALAAGADPAAIVMHGNAKSDTDIQAALDARIGFLGIDGFDDIDRLARLTESARLDRASVRVLLRVSPGIESPTHAALATGGQASKFGVPAGQAPEAIARLRAIPAVELAGLHAHIGSQILALEYFDSEVAALAMLDRFGTYDLGGGLGVRYVPTDTAPSISDYARRLAVAARSSLGADVRLLIEPGRSVVAASCMTVYRVVTIKRAGRLHVAVDGGMSDNLEPSLYGQQFAPLVVGKWDEPEVVADLVGQHCESGDVIAAGVPLRDPRVGDLMVVPVTGAYCFTMSNNYNAALRPPVIFCADGKARLGVRRETFDDLLAREVGMA
jgi:diaminopimelate decarboxylase